MRAFVAVLTLAVLILCLVLWSKIEGDDALAPEPRPTASTVTTAPSSGTIVTLPVRYSHSLSMSAHLNRIKQCESGGDYQAVSRSGQYSGAYQVSDATWDGYAGYRRAADAPPEVQEKWAREAYRLAGSRPWPYCGRI